MCFFLIHLSWAKARALVRESSYVAPSEWELGHGAQVTYLPYTACAVSPTSYIPIPVNQNILVFCSHPRLGARTILWAEGVVGFLSNMVCRAPSCVHFCQPFNLSDVGPQVSLSKLALRSSWSSTCRSAGSIKRHSSIGANIVLCRSHVSVW